MALRNSRRRVPPPAGPLVVALRCGIMTGGAAAAVVGHSRNGGLHAVAELKSSSGTLVYDSLYPRPEPRKALEQDGYRWVAEFAVEGAVTP